MSRLRVREHAKLLIEAPTDLAMALLLAVCAGILAIMWLQGGTSTMPGDLEPLPTPTAPAKIA